MLSFNYKFCEVRYELTDSRKFYSVNVLNTRNIRYSFVAYHDTCMLQDIGLSCVSHFQSCSICCYNALRMVENFNLAKKYGIAK